MPLSRRIAIAAIPILFLAIGVEAQADSINSQIQSWTELNRACRGASGDSPTTWEACKKREAAGALLKQHGLCQGKYNLGGGLATGRQKHLCVKSGFLVTTEI